MVTAFLDISKAYDNVDRDKLYERLRELGMGGRTRSLIISLYAVDFLKFQVNGELTRALYPRVGVKQGCFLSPPIFNLIMTLMAERLNNTKLGIPFGRNTASNVIYADNVTLLAGSRENLNKLMQRKRQGY